MKKYIKKQKRAIHTNLEISTISELIELGDGRLNEGIEEANRIVKSKRFDVETQLMKIARQIMHK